MASGKSLELAKLQGPRRIEYYAPGVGNTRCLARLKEMRDRLEHRMLTGLPFRRCDAERLRMLERKLAAQPHGR